MADKLAFDLHGMTLVEMCRAYPEQAAAAIQKYAMESAKTTHNTGMDEIAFLKGLLECEDNSLCSMCRIDIEVRLARLHHT